LTIIERRIAFASTGQHTRRDETRGGARVEDLARADVGDHVAAHRLDGSVGVVGRLDVHALLTRMHGADHVLGAILDPPHRALEMHRQPRHHDLFRVLVQLRPEPTADVRRDHPDLRLGQAEHERQGRPQHVRHLRRGPHREAIAAILGDDAAGLHRIAGLALASDRQLDRRILVERGCDGLARVREVEQAIVVPVLVELGRPVCQRVLDRRDRRQGLVVDCDGRRRVLGLIAVVGNDHGHGCAHETDAVARQREQMHVLEEVQELRELLDAGELPCGDDGVDVRVAPDFVGVDRIDLRVRVGTPNERRLHHARHPQIGDETGGSVEERAVLSATARRSDRRVADPVTEIEIQLS
jgi:hypothetical protein